MDSETVKKNGVARPPGVYIAISFRHFLWRKWTLIQGFGNRQKNGVGRPPGVYIAISFRHFYRKWILIHGLGTR